MEIKKVNITTYAYKRFFCFMMEMFNRLPRNIRSYFSKIINKPIIDKRASFCGLPIFLGKCKIGAYTFMNGDAYLEDVEIGSYCSIGRDLHTINGNHIMTNFSTYTFGHYNKKDPFMKYSFSDNIREKTSGITLKTYIGNDVWIGSYVTILGGVQIGTGAVIGAGSVVTKDIPPYAIAVGNPAKVIRYRFNQEKINKLLQSEWWTYSPEKLAQEWEYLNNI